MCFFTHRPYQSPSPHLKMSVREEERERDRKWISEARFLCALVVTLWTQCRSRFYNFCKSTVLREFKLEGKFDLAFYHVADEFFCCFLSTHYGVKVSFSYYLFFEEKNRPAYRIGYKWSNFHEMIIFLLGTWIISRDIYSLKAGAGGTFMTYTSLKNFPPPSSHTHSYLLVDANRRRKFSSIKFIIHLTIGINVFMEFIEMRMEESEISNAMKWSIKDKYITLHAFEKCEKNFFVFFFYSNWFWSLAEEFDGNFMENFMNSRRNPKEGF